MAKKKLLILIILVVLAAAAAATAILLFARPVEQAGDELITVAEIRPQDVSLMKINREGTTVSLVRKDGTWHYEDDDDATADQLLTESALTYVSYVYANEIISDSVENKAAYGLDPAELTVSLKLNSGQEYTYLFGLPTSDQKNVFMQLQGDSRLYLFGRDKYKQIVSSLENVKDLSMKIDSRSLVAFSLSWPARDVIMDFEKIPDNERTGTEEWMITSPFNAVANISAVGLTQSLFNPARLGGFVAEGTGSDYGIDENSFSLTMKDSDGNAVSMKVGDQTPEGNYYCEVSDREGIYTTYQGIEALLKLDEADAVSPFVFPVSDRILPPFKLLVNDSKFTFEALETHDNGYLLNGTVLSSEDVVMIAQAMRMITLDGPAPREPMTTAEIKFEMGQFQLQFEVYKNDYFLVAMDEIPFGYVKIDKLAALIDLLDTLAA